MVYGISDRYKVLSILVSVNRRRRKVFEGVSHSFKKKKEHFNISSNAIELFEYNKFNCVCINKKKKSTRFNGARMVKKLQHVIWLTKSLLNILLDKSMVTDTLISTGYLREALSAWRINNQPMTNFCILY